MRLNEESHCLYDRVIEVQLFSVLNEAECWLESGLKESKDIGTSLDTTEISEVLNDVPYLLNCHVGLEPIVNAIRCFRHQSAHYAFQESVVLPY